MTYLLLCGLQHLALIIQSHNMYLSASQISLIIVYFHLFIHHTLHGVSPNFLMILVHLNHNILVYFRLFFLLFILVYMHVQKKSI